MRLSGGSSSLYAEGPILALMVNGPKNLNASLAHGRLATDFCT